MRVVIDTNVLLNAVYKHSKNYWIRQALESGALTLCVTTDILDEYSEVLAGFYDSETAELFLSALELLPNLHFVHKYFFWQLIPQDEDDEKFADCAIASGADFLVTNDRHFNPLKKLPYPKINIVDETEFLEICKEKLGLGA
jgi:uncharacterized protein